MTVIHPDATLDQYIYQRRIFAPTDVHTATLLGDHILLIGSLGYQGARHEGETQVLRLSLVDFSISKVKTPGENSGWISRHKAGAGEGCIVISGGNTEHGCVGNTDVFVLDLADMVWSWAA